MVFKKGHKVKRKKKFRLRLPKFLRKKKKIKFRTKKGKVVTFNTR